MIRTKLSKWIGRISSQKDMEIYNLQEDDAVRSNTRIFTFRTKIMYFELCNHWKTFLSKVTPTFAKKKIKVETGLLAAKLISCCISACMFDFLDLVFWLRKVVKSQVLFIALKISWKKSVIHIYIHIYLQIRNNIEVQDIYTKWAQDKNLNELNTCKCHSLSPTLLHCRNNRRIKKVLWAQLQKRQKIDYISKTWTFFNGHNIIYVCHVGHVFEHTLLRHCMLFLHQRKQKL